MENYLTYKINEQPNLCTLIDKKIIIKDNKTILSQSRADITGSVICHLGEVHLKRKAKGNIINSIKVIE